MFVFGDTYAHTSSPVWSNVKSIVQSMFYRTFYKRVAIKRLEMIFLGYSTLRYKIYLMSYVKSFETKMRLRKISSYDMIFIFVTIMLSVKRHS